ncbi:ABC transporter substrate-binding protein [Thermophilibacter provencensis]|uniref:ABC transporter substrate-binding protein n=1 Tax=Thermophilibacter provencensis TaxID=1852386 RepID=A0A921GEB4_9ACTN|nr:ABC transporter substrate-binding protein [Thermophilibacter provencensis]MBM6814377.1 ABC transporter substrate-binding protein [Olsenella uli]HJF45195.1 ABC transporter substrate-binding protein [Thermophilibacter provencensis]
MFENVSRRQFVTGSAAAIMGLGLVGCGGNGGGEGGDGASSIKVGIMGPHTGDNSSYGLACLNGAQLYFKQLNADGGVNGKQIEAVVYDTKGDATEAVNAYNRLVQEDGVTGIVGSVLTGPTIAVAQASVADNMPCVTPSATAADVVTYGSNYFRACVTDPEQGRVMAHFASEQGYKNVATLYLSGSDYSEGVNAAFCDEAESLGITITTQQSYADGDVDFKAQLTNIIATNPDAILVPNYYQDDGMIVNQARTQGYDKVFLGVDGWSGIYGGSENYADAANLHDCYYCCAFSSSNESETATKFVSDYEAEYGEAPTNFCALGYDAAMVLAAGLTAAEEAGLEAGSDEYKQAVIDGVASGTVEGVTGSISYEGTGDPVKSSLIITFAEDGAEETFQVLEA